MSRALFGPRAARITAHTWLTLGYVFLYLAALSLVMRTLVLGPVVHRIGEPGAMRAGTVLITLGLLLMPLAHTLPLFGTVTTADEVNRIFADSEIPRRMESLARRGYTLVGDVEPRTVAGRASWLTPVPGGVGPLTIAMLMKNTLRAAEMRRG